jgi:hypothetical protein
MAAKANIIIDQGATFSTYLNLTDDSDNPIDLSNYQAFAQMRKWYTSSAFTIFNIMIPDPTSGNIFISLDANTTANLAAGRYVYDIDTIDSTNVVTRVIEGIVTVTPEVTQITWT